MSLFALTVGVIPAALADQTTVGISVNATTGHHIESTGVSAVPIVPLPILDIDYRHHRLHLHGEAVPPIGPVSLPTNFGMGQDPRLSYLNAEALYSLVGGRYEFGIGETIVNQRTVYPPSPLIQASRVVGARYIGHMRIYSTPTESLEASLAINGSMHGVQYSMIPGASVSDPERASMVDAWLRWSRPFAHSTFSYGLRYINYAAAYTANGALADRNHFLMPFIAMDWNLRRDVPDLVLDPQANGPDFRVNRVAKTTADVSFFGSTGSRSVTEGPVSAKAFAIFPEFSVERRVGAFGVRADGFFPSSSVDIFGSKNFSTSYLNAGILLHSADGRYAIGLGDAVINGKPTSLPSFVTPFSLHTRSDGLRYSAFVTNPLPSGRNVSLQVNVVPYLRSTTFFTGETREGVVQTIASNRRASIVDASLSWKLPMHAFDFSYGLRYVNLSTLLFSSASLPGYSFVSHDTSFMPFVGITKNF